MVNCDLKIKLDKVQKLLSYCITQTYNILIGNIMRKKGCISNMQLKEILQKEYIRVTDELFFHLSELSCPRMCREVLQ